MSRSIYRHIYLERIVSTQETNKRLLLPAYIINTCFLTQTTSNYHNNRFKLHTFPSNNRRPLNFPFHHIQIHARDEHIQSSALYTPRNIANHKSSSERLTSHLVSCERDEILNFHLPVPESSSFRPWQRWLQLFQHPLHFRKVPLLFFGDFRTPWWYISSFVLNWVRCFFEYIFLNRYVFAKSTYNMNLCFVLSVWYRAVLDRLLGHHHHHYSHRCLDGWMLSHEGCWTRAAISFRYVYGL